jgi:hypothetical protein
MPRYRRTEAREAVHYFFIPYLVLKTISVQFVYEVTGIPPSTLRNWRRRYKQDFPDELTAMLYAERVHLLTLQKDFFKMCRLVRASILYHSVENEGDIPTGYCLPVIIAAKECLEQKRLTRNVHPYLDCLLDNDALAFHCLTKSQEELKNFGIVSLTERIPTG